MTKHDRLDLVSRHGTAHRPDEPQGHVVGPKWSNGRASSARLAILILTFSLPASCSRHGRTIGCTTIAQHRRGCCRTRASDGGRTPPSQPPSQARRQRKSIHHVAQPRSGCHGSRPAHRQQRQRLALCLCGQSSGCVTGNGHGWSRCAQRCPGRSWWSFGRWTWLAIRRSSRRCWHGCSTQPTWSQAQRYGSRRRRWHGRCPKKWHGCWHRPPSSTTRASSRRCWRFQQARRRSIAAGWRRGHVDAL